MEQSTIDKVASAYKSHGSYRKTAKVLGVGHGVVWNMLNGRENDVSKEVENRVRLTLSLSPIAPRIEVDPCPDCGSVHHGRCYGKPVEVRPARARRPFVRWRDASIAILSAAIRNRQEYP